MEVPGGLFHDGCGLVAISSTRETYEARGMAACGINFKSSDHPTEKYTKCIKVGRVSGENSAQKQRTASAFCSQGGASQALT